MNEENWIGGQTFSIREIQEEWGLSFTALNVAMEEHIGDINGGRGKSLLASIVGLTTRYPPLSFSLLVCIFSKKNCLFVYCLGRR